MTGQYAVEFIDVNVYIYKPVLITAVSQEGYGGGFSGEWFLVYPPPFEGLALGSVPTGASFSAEETMADARSQAITKLINVEVERVKKQGVPETYQVPKLIPGKIEELLKYCMVDMCKDKIDTIAKSTRCVELTRALNGLRTAAASLSFK